MFYSVINTERLFLAERKIDMEKNETLNRSENMNRDEKLKALDAAISQIEKQYGKGAVMKL